MEICLMHLARPVVECLPQDCCPSTGAAEEGGLHAAGVQVRPIERGHHWEGGLQRRKGWGDEGMEGG